MEGAVRATAQSRRHRERPPHRCRRAKRRFLLHLRSCAAVVLKTIETTLADTPGVVNGPRQSLALVASPSRSILRSPRPELVVAAIKRAGFSAAPLIDGGDEIHAARVGELLPRVGVAGFAAANIMLLSVSVWSGHASDMDDSMKTLFHWISALIASAGDRLCGAAVLQVGLCRPVRAPPQYGRADLSRHYARHRDELRPDHARDRPRLF